MKKVLHIRRQESADSEAYWEDFSYECMDDTASVATALSQISAKDRIGDKVDAVRPIAWEHGCLQKKCGACAMVIDGIPRLACDVRLSGLKKEIITIEPLRKFPVVEDLIVDRSYMMDRLKELSAWFEGDAKVGNEDMAFEAAKCLQCGICLEVCPNFDTGGSFSGMAGMAPIARLISKLPDAQRKRVARDYKKAVYNGCGKSLACRNICPAGIDMENLLVKSNAAAVWNRWGKNVKESI